MIPHLLEREPDDRPDLRAPATTVVVRRQQSAGSAPAKRRRAVSRREVADLVGALASALAVTLLLFGRVAPFSGSLGFVLCTYVTFLVIYATLVSVGEERPAVVDKVMAVLMATAALVAVGALASVISFTLWRGRTALSRVNLYVEDMSLAGPADPLSVGGIAHAVVGTVVMLVIALLITVPLGLTCAVYLNESRTRLSQLVRTVVDAMTALPSILAGLFIFATWILLLGFERSALAAGLAVSIMMLPIIIRSSDVVLRLVPGNLREASEALGGPRWRTVWHVVLPTARSGLTTSIILGVARGIGETAPVLLTAGFTSTMNVNPVQGPMVSLPLAAFEFVRSPQPALVARGFATSAVLMLLVLALFAVARVLGGHPAGHISSRQARRRQRQSQHDLERFSSLTDHKEHP